MEKVLIEKCLNNIPNKFELSILVMNRAKEILSGSRTDIETTRYTKKSVNKALKEIENNELDIDSLKERIRNNSFNSDLFLKESNKIDDSYEDSDNYDLDDNLDDDDSFDESEDEYFEEDDEDIEEE